MIKVKLERPFFDGTRYHRDEAELPEGTALPSDAMIWDEKSGAWAEVGSANVVSAQTSDSDEPGDQPFKAKLYPGARKVFTSADGMKEVPRAEAVAKALLDYEKEGHTANDWNETLNDTQRRGRVERAARSLLGEPENDA